MKKILYTCILLLLVINLVACVPPNLKEAANNTIPNPSGERLYPYKVTTDSGKSFKYGYIDKLGKIIIKPQYDYADFYDNGYYRVETGNKWGMLDSKGSVIIKEIYQGLGTFEEGLAVAKLNGKCGYIDKSGNAILPFQFNTANAFSEGKAYVVNKGSNEYIDKKGKVLAKSFNYMCISGFKDGYAAISLDNKYGYIDENFKIIIEPQYQITKDFENGIALVGYSLNKCYLVNKKGETVLKFPEGYTLDAVHVSGYGEGLIPVYKNGRAGYMDMKGNIVIACIFTGASRFVDGYALVTKDDKICVIDKKGNILTDSLPKDRINMGIIDDMVLYSCDKGTVYYTLTGKKIFSSIGN